MPFEKIVTCERISITDDELNLHAVTPVFRRGGPAVVLYCRIARLPFVLPASYSLEIVRHTDGESVTVLHLQKRPIGSNNRLFSVPILYVFAPPYGLELGYYSAILALNSGERTEVEFLVS